MQYIKPILIVLFMATFFFTACTETEKKQTDASVIQEDTLKEEKKSEVIADDDKKEEITEKPVTPKLEGAWEIKRAVGSSVKSNLGTVYTFEGDKLSLEKNGFNNPGKTEITDSTFSFTADSNPYKFMYDYKFDGDTLVVTVQNSNGQTFYMVRK